MPETTSTSSSRNERIRDSVTGVVGNLSSEVSSTAEALSLDETIGPALRGTSPVELPGPDQSFVDRALENAPVVDADSAPSTGAIVAIAVAIGFALLVVGGGLDGRL